MTLFVCTIRTARRLPVPVMLLSELQGHAKLEAAELPPLNYWYNRMWRGRPLGVERFGRWRGLPPKGSMARCLGLPRHLTLILIILYQRCWRGADFNRALFLFQVPVASIEPRVLFGLPSSCLWRRACSLFLSPWQNMKGDRTHFDMSVGHSDESLYSSFWACMASVDRAGHSSFPAR